MRTTVRESLRNGLAVVLLAVCASSVHAATEVDVALSYSPDAAARQGGEANIQVNLANAIVGANADHARSGTGVRLRIAGFYQSTANPVNQDNNYVLGLVNGDASFADVRSFYTSVGADLLSYYSHNTGAAGNAYQPGTFSTMGEQWIYHLVVAHELGHNFGCDHRDGHANPKTLMLHNYCGGGAQGWFSNPQIWLGGVQLLGGDSCLGAGVAGGDNSAVIATAAQGKSDVAARVVYGPDLNDALLHWSFTHAPGAAPAGTTVADSVSGTALATVLGNGATFTNNALRIPGGASGSGAAYLQLPGGIISSLTNVTIEVWAAPLSVQNWGRVLDFNNGTANYITLSSSIGTDLASQRFTTIVGGATTTLDSGLATTAGVQHHYTITFTDGAAGGRWQWYRDGDAVAFLDVTNHLANIQDVNNWLGRSAYGADALANCDYAEVRISSVAMSRGQILANYLLGPNYVPASVTLTNNDAFGATSFNAAGQWSSGAVPNAGNSYETFDFQLRTPATGSSYTFAGNALKISGGALVYKGSSSSTITVPNLVLNNGTVLNGSGPICTLAGGLSATTNGGVINGAYGRPFVISASLSGSGPLTFLSGPTTLTGNNSAFTGQTLIGNGVAGTLIIDSPARLGAVPAAFTSDQLVLNRGTLQTTATMALGNDNRGILLDVSGGTFNVASGTTLTVASTLASPVVAGATVGSLEKTGAGTLVLSGPANTFNGMVFVDTGSSSANDGIVKVANNQVLAGAHSPIYINNNTAGSSTLQLDGTSGNITLPQWISLAGRNGTTPAIENIAGTNSINGMAIYAGGANYIVQSDAGLLTFYGAAVQSGVSGSRTLTFQGNGDSAVTSTLQNGAATPLNLAKGGTGKLTLSGAGNYTGTTTVNGGALLVNNSLGPNTVTVASGGTLGGNGTIAGAVAVQSGGSLSPGTSAGVLTINSNVTLNAGSTTFMEVNKTPLTNDQLRVTGALTYGGTLSVSNLAGTLALGDSFGLFNAAGKVGSFAATNLPALDPGLAWSFNPVSGVLSVISTGNTPPTISSVSNQTVDENISTVALALTVGDAETPAGSLTLSGTSSNPALVPAGNILFGGSGASRTVTILPATNQSGSATITLAVGDGALVTTTSFVLTVNFVNQPPTISTIPNQIGRKIRRWDRWPLRLVMRKRRRGH